MLKLSTKQLERIMDKIIIWIESDNLRLYATMAILGVAAGALSNLAGM